MDENCEYVNFIKAAPQEEFNKNCFFNSFETPLVHSTASIEFVSLKVLIPINWLINPRIFM